MEQFRKCEEITDTLGNNCFKTVSLNNSDYCYCKNEPEVVFNLKSYNNNYNCKDCKDKYTNPIENKLYSSLNELIAKVHGTANIIENLTSEVNDLYESFKQKLEDYKTISNLINNTKYLISVEESKYNKLKTTVLSNEEDYSNYLKESTSYNTQMQNEINKINNFN